MPTSKINPTIYHKFILEEDRLQMWGHRISILSLNVDVTITHFSPNSNSLSVITYKSHILMNLSHCKLSCRQNEKWSNCDTTAVLMQHVFIDISGHRTPTSSRLVVGDSGLWLYLVAVQFLMAMVMTSYLYCMLILFISIYLKTMTLHQDMYSLWANRMLSRVSSPDMLPCWFYV